MPSVLSKPRDDTEHCFLWARYEMGQCYLNANINRNLAFKHLALKPVYGSLGLNGHFEFGGRNHSAADFFKNPMDSHCWLEDEDGMVYDYIFPEYAEAAETWGKAVTFPTDFHLQGWSKADLKELYGLEYIPAPIKAQRDIVKNVKVFQKKAFRGTHLSAEHVPIYCP